MSLKTPGERSRDYSTRIRVTPAVRHGSVWESVERRWDALNIATGNDGLEYRDPANAVPGPGCLCRPPGHRPRSTRRASGGYRESAWRSSIRVDPDRHGHQRRDPQSGRRSGLLARDAAGRAPRHCAALGSAAARRIPAPPSLFATRLAGPDQRDDDHRRRFALHPQPARAWTTPRRSHSRRHSTIDRTP